MPAPIAKLAHDILDDPVRVDVAPAKIAVDRIDQRVFFVGAKDKRALLEGLLADRDMDRVLVFTRTKRGADRVCRNLVQAGFAAVALHGNKAQNARVRALESFRQGHVRVLVATDIAARGIDVPNISHVINYELPNEPESYVHRIGRTARAGAGGRSLVVLRSQRAASSPGDRAVDAVARRRGGASARRIAARAASSAAAERGHPSANRHRVPPPALRRRPASRAHARERRARLPSLEEIQDEQTFLTRLRRTAQCRGASQQERKSVKQTFKLDQEREHEAMMLKTARLRELRLAKEAAENENKPEAAAPAPRAPKPRRSKQT